jgi:serine/threonine protein kinase
MRNKRIVHRDLKLENIMVRINPDKSKDYVITDFGLACWIGEQELLYERCGTPGYIAPEILRANKSKVIVSHSSDIFSLGVIFHFMYLCPKLSFLLKAVFPFNGNPKELLILNKKAVFDLETRSHLKLMSTERRLLEKTLELNVTKRASSRELLDVYIKDYEKEAGYYMKSVGESRRRKDSCENPSSRR